MFQHRRDNRPSLCERFERYVERGPYCWTWIGYKDSTVGYGRLNVGGKCRWAHRVSYVLAFGAIPKGLCVCHRCDNPVCVNPNHLFLATNEGNAIDMAQKLRSTWGQKNRHAKITVEDAAKIRYTYKNNRQAVRALADEIGVSYGHALAIGRGTFWKHIS